MKHNSMVCPFRLGPALLHLLPNASFLKRLSSAHLRLYLGDNNVWADSNGDFFILRRFMPYCKVVFDIGANVGDWSRLALDTNAHMQIHCFERAADTFYLLQNASLGKTAHLNNYAGSDSCGDVELRVFSDTSPFNSIVAHSSFSSPSCIGTEKKNSITIDRYAKDNLMDRIDYARIDVEGAELLVIQGMGELLQMGKVDAIPFEHRRFSIYSTTLILYYFMIFQTHHFVMFNIAKEGLQFYDTYVDLLESFNHQDWLAVRRDCASNTLAASLVIL